MEHSKPTQTTVLVIDDEVAIVEIIQTVLEGEGYRVYGTTSPLEGVELYRKDWSSIALVISDFNMPEMTGGEVLHRLKQINPNVAMLLVTGSRDYLDVDSLEREVRGLVQKPFHLDELIRQVNDVVEQVSMFEMTKLVSKNVK